MNEKQLRRRKRRVDRVFRLVSILFFWARGGEMTLRRYRVPCHKLTRPLRLAHISDLHGTSFGPNQKELLERLAAEQPDLVCLTGDIIDGALDAAASWTLLEALPRRCPCFYVLGNHEFRTGHYEDVVERAEALGVVRLAGTGQSLEINGQTVYLAGVDDPTAFKRKILAGSWEEQLARVQAEKTDGPRILLSHRPERVQAYRETDFDLVLCGHAHGGQMRIPGLVNGLFAPHQGWFPKYAGGQYDLGGPTMVVSRGLCRGVMPRVFNPPELVMIDLVPGD